MNVHWFQHAGFEGLGMIEPWLKARGHTLTVTRWWAGETMDVHALESCDWLIVMGGPMNIYHYRDYPWLPREKAALRAAMHGGKRVLGVCLGAQLIADVLGAKVVQNPEPEIGWWPIQAPASGQSEVAGGTPFLLPTECVVFHWHGDTFTLPAGAVPLARSDACANQAFAWGSRVLALQFHLEMDEAAVNDLARACANELVPGGRRIQTADELRPGARIHAADTRALLDRLLTALENG